MRCGRCGRRFDWRRADPVAPLLHTAAVHSKWVIYGVPAAAGASLLWAVAGSTGLLWILKLVSWIVAGLLALASLAWLVWALVAAYVVGKAIEAVFKALADAFR